MSDLIGSEVTFLPHPNIKSDSLQEVHHSSSLRTLAALFPVRDSTETATMSSFGGILHSGREMTDDRPPPLSHLFITVVTLSNRRRTTYSLSLMAAFRSCCYENTKFLQLNVKTTAVTILQS